MGGKGKGGGATEQPVGVVLKWEVSGLGLVLIYGRWYGLYVVNNSLVFKAAGETESLSAGRQTLAHANRFQSSATGAKFFKSSWRNIC